MHTLCNIGTYEDELQVLAICPVLGQEAYCYILFYATILNLQTCQTLKNDTFNAVFNSVINFIQKTSDLLALSHIMVIRLMDISTNIHVLND